MSLFKSVNIFKLLYFFCCCSYYSIFVIVAVWCLNGVYPKCRSKGILEATLKYNKKALSLKTI